MLLYRQVFTEALAMAGHVETITAQSIFAGGAAYHEREVTFRTVTLAQAKEAHHRLRLNVDAVPYTLLLRGMRVEIEHGSKYGPVGNVTHDDMLKTAQIALVHIMEFRDYYDRLERLERKATAYWEARAQRSDFALPPLFLS